MVISERFSGRLVVPIITVVLSACRPLPEEAGLTGKNPLVSISIESLSADAPYHDKTTISKDGAIWFEAGDGETIKTRRERRADAEMFSELAIDFAPYRPAPGRTTMEAKTCLKDAGTTIVTWAFADGSKRYNRVGNDCDPGNQTGKLLASLSDRLGTKEWKREAWKRVY